MFQIILREAVVTFIVTVVVLVDIILLFSCYYLIKKGHAIRHILVPVLIFFIIGFAFMGVRDCRRIRWEYKMSQQRLPEPPVVIKSDNQSAVKEALQMQIDADRKKLEEKVSRVKPYRGGMYFFPFVGREFREVYGVFVDTHPDLEFVGWRDDVEDYPPFARPGVTVIFRPKKTETGH